MAKKAPLPCHPPGLDEAVEALLIDLGEARKPGDTRSRGKRRRDGEFAGIADLLGWLLRLAELMRKTNPEIVGEIARQGYAFDDQKDESPPGLDILIGHLRRVAGTYLRLGDVPADPFEILAVWDGLRRNFDPVENRFGLHSDMAPRLLMLDWDRQRGEPGQATERVAIETGPDPLPDVLLNALYTASSLPHSSGSDRFELFAYRLCEALRHMVMILSEREKTLRARSSRKFVGDLETSNARPAELFALEYIRIHHADPRDGRLRKKRTIAKEIQAAINEEFTKPGDWSAAGDGSLRMIERWITPQWQELKRLEKAGELLTVGHHSRLEKSQDIVDPWP